MNDHHTEELVRHVANNDDELHQLVDEQMREALQYLRRTEDPHRAFVFAALAEPAAGQTTVFCFAGGSDEHVDYLLEGIRQLHHEGKMP